MFRKLHSILNFGQSKITHSAQMVRVQWRLGVLITVLIGVLWHYNLLYFVERVTLDHRTQFFWKHAPDPSTQVVVVGVDDPAEESVGRWPWHRSDLAVVVRELKRAGTKVVALDLLLSEPEQARIVYKPADPFAAPSDAEQPQLMTDVVQDDDDLAAAIAEHGGVIVAGNFKFVQRDAAEAMLSGRASPNAAEPQKADEAGVEVVKIPVSTIFDAIRSIRTGRGLPPGLVIDPGFSILDAGAYDRIAELVLPRFHERWKSLTPLSPEIRKFRVAFQAAVTLVDRGRDSSIPIERANYEGQTEPRPFPFSISPSPPIRPLAIAAARMANVTFDSYDDDAIVRKVPLWVEHNDRLWPTLGLAAVMQYEGLKIQAVDILNETTLLTRANGQRQPIEMLTAEQREGVFDGLHFITWPRGIYRRPAWGNGVRGWEWQFYLPPGAVLARHQLEKHSGGEGHPTAPNAEMPSVTDAKGVAGKSAEGKGTDESLPAMASEISAGRLHEPARITNTIRQNLRDMAKSFVATYVRCNLCTSENAEIFKTAIRRLLVIEVDDGAWEAEWKRVVAVIDECAAAAREELAIEFAADPDKAFDDGAAARADGSPAMLKRLLAASIPDAIKNETDPVKREEAINRIENLRGALQYFPVFASEIGDGILRITSIRRGLKDRLEGRIAFFGFVATGSIADFVGTSIDPRTPGVHGHAAVANAILNNHFKTQWFWLYDYICIAVLGMMGTFLAIRSSVIAAPVFVVLLMAGWTAFSGMYLWDRFNIINSVSGPSFASLAGVGVVLLHRLLVEQKDRRRVEERFKAYVAPDVVDELVNNPELASMVPFARDMTVMFTDVADFTTTSERLGPVRLAAFLDRYLGEMTRILQANRGTRDKYLGDGIMCFWNAPRLDKDHAYHACVTAVKMLQRLDQLNAEGAFSDAGLVKVRIGIAAGSLMVGDFGNPPVNSSYTVLGDTANLSSRLESANKFFGSRILANQRVKDLAIAPEGQPPLRWRRIGKVNVKGKKEAESLWELVGELSPHGPATDEWIAQTETAVMAYQKGDFDGAAVTFDAIAKRFGDEALGEIYVHSIELWKGRPDRETAFDGAIVLTEK